MADTGIYDLSAKLTLEMGKYDQQVNSALQGGKKLETGLKQLESQHAKNSAAAQSHGNILSKVLSHSLEEVTSKVQGATHEMGGLGTALSAAAGEVGGLTGPLGLVLGGLAALATTGVAAGVAIFEIVHKSAEAGLELEHLQEQTGLTAKTITALKFASDESGKSIEGFDRGMKIFENTVAKAAQGSEEAEKALKRLGVTPKAALQDLDGTLAKAFAFVHPAICR